MKRLVAVYGRSHLRDIQLAYDGRSNLFTTRQLPDPFQEQEAVYLTVDVCKDDGDKSVKFDIGSSLGYFHVAYLFAVQAFDWSRKWIWRQFNVTFRPVVLKCPRIRSRHWKS